MHSDVYLHREKETQLLVTRSNLNKVKLVLVHEHLFYIARFHTQVLLWALVEYVVIKSVHTTYIFCNIFNRFWYWGNANFMLNKQMCACAHVCGHIHTHTRKLQKAAVLVTVLLP